MDCHKTTLFLKRLSILLLFSSITTYSNAHQRSATATYLGNEAILVTSDGGKVLFDPFFHSSFGVYQLVPEDIRLAIMRGTQPYNNIDVIVISHAHGDHFSPGDVLSYLQAFPLTKLVAPKQAVEQILENIKGHESEKQLQSQMISVALVLGDKAISVEVGSITFEAVRIPHSGWPGRADIENIVFRVTLNDGSDGASTVMHMGDADANDEHYLPHKQHWLKRITDTAFPPYWFYGSAEGNDILNEIINAKHSIGLHVPVIVPNSLKKSGKDYFSKPGEQRKITHQH